MKIKQNCMFPLLHAVLWLVYSDREQRRSRPYWGLTTGASVDSTANDLHSLIVGRNCEDFIKQTVVYSGRTVSPVTVQQCWRNSVLKLMWLVPVLSVSVTVAVVLQSVMLITVFHLKWSTTNVHIALIRYLPRNFHGLLTIIVIVITLVLNTGLLFLLT